MNIKLNGESRQVPAGTTVAEVVADLPQRGTAVAVNGQVVPRADHAESVLAEGDIVEIVTAVQGG